MDHDLLAMLQSLDDSPVERESYLRCPWPYAGAKSRSLDKILPRLRHSDSWIEGFGGTGVVTMNRAKSKFEVFNDRHAGIVAFYRCVRDKAKFGNLMDRLELTIHAREEYIWSIETWESDLLDDVERAARWYYTLAYSFGGIGRNFGRSLTGSGTLSGKIRSNLALFQPIHERFRNVQIENMDWRQVLKDYDSQDATFYLDPPYYGKNCFRHNMSKADHVEMCEKIFRCRGFVALSGYDNEVYDKFPWDAKHTWPAHVSVTTKAVRTDTSNVTRIGTDESVEVLWIKESD